jgi:hypothetical protein
MKFKPASDTARQEVLDYAKEELKVYGVNPDDCEEYEIDAYFNKNWDAFKVIAVRQGNVWSLSDFEEGLNSEYIWSPSLFIKIL